MTLQNTFTFSVSVLLCYIEIIFHKSTTLPTPTMRKHQRRMQLSHADFPEIILRRMLQNLGTPSTTSPYRDERSVIPRPQAVGQRTTPCCQHSNCSSDWSFPLTKKFALVGVDFRKHVLTLWRDVGKSARQHCTLIFGQRPAGRATT